MFFSGNIIPWDGDSGGWKGDGCRGFGEGRGSGGCDGNCFDCLSLITEVVVGELPHFTHDLEYLPCDLYHRHTPRLGCRPDASAA